MNLSKERMDHITRLVEGGFPLKTDEVEDLHGMNYHLYCLCDTYQAMKIRAENEVETLKAENEKLKAESRELKDVKLGLSWAFGELKIDAESLRKDAERYRWLRDRKPNSLHLGYNDDHACNYMTASEWIDYVPDLFQDETEEQILNMRESGTIWRLQIYPDTPVGFFAWNRSTLDDVVDAAMAQEQQS